MLLFDCVYDNGLLLMFGGHKTVISTVLRPTKVFTGKLLAVSNDWPGIKQDLFICLYFIQINSIHSVIQIEVANSSHSCFVCRLSPLT